MYHRINVNIQEIIADSERYFYKMCGFDRDLDGNRERVQEAKTVRDEYLDSLKLNLLISEYPASVICGEEFQFPYHLDHLVPDSEYLIIPCKVLGRLSTDIIQKVYLYAMCITEPEEAMKQIKGELLKEFYLDTWMTAFIDAGRDWIKSYLTNQLEQEILGTVRTSSYSSLTRGKKFHRSGEKQRIFLSDSFGPGFYGMEIEMVEDFFRLLPCERIGMSLKHGTMFPAKSNVGIYLALTEESSLPSKDCKNCRSGGKSCEFCKNYVSMPVGYMKKED